MSYLSGVQDLEVVTTAQGTFLVATSGAGGGVTTFALSPGKAPKLVDQQGLPGSGATVPVAEIGVVQVGNQVLLLSPNGGGLSGVSLSGTGMLDPGTGVAGPGSASAFVSVSIGGATYVYAAEGAGGGIAGYAVAPDLALTAAGGAQATGGYGGDVSAMATATVGGTAYVLAASASGDGVASYSVDPATGALTLVGGIGAQEGLGVNTPTGIQTVTIGGATYAIMASAGSSSISVVAVGADGSLTATDHVIDTLDTRFDGVTALEAITVGDRAFIIVGGADDGLTLFTLLPDGTLVYLQTISDSAATTLDNVAAITAVQVGSDIQVFVSSQSEPGISQFVLPVAALGVTLTAPGSGGTLAGGAGEDLLMGGAGNDTLTGGAGADILVDGAGSDRMTGGSGADIFVLSFDGVLDTITDFEAGVDRLDLSAWPMLYDPSQLTFQSTSYGAIISYRGEVLEIYSADGRSLTLAQVFPGGFIGPDRPPLVLTTPDIVATPGPDHLVGTEWDDEIFGLAGNDTILGGAGNDLLDGGEGDDYIEGGDGNDRIHGGPGNDTIRAGNGDDQVWGGPGSDTVMLGEGDDVFDDSAQTAPGPGDTVWGWTGNDIIRGGAGDDVFYGEDGEDILEGGGGDDKLYGGNGYDTIRGGDGDDQIWGGNGRDLIYMGNGDDIFYDNDQTGEKGGDTVYAGPGNDTIYGRGGDDVLHGEEGDDYIEGGEGNDMIHGGPGNDTIRAGTGNDQVWGGAGSDTVMLGEGDDVFDDSAQTAPGPGDTVWGWTGNDIIKGGAGDDVFYGEDGNDTLIGNGGDDQLYGGNGDDLIRGGDGDDQVWGGNGRDLVYLGNGDDIFYDNDQTGPQGADTVYAGPGNDTIYGRGGDDLLYGEEGDDYIEGGDGNDRIHGGPGNDTIRAGNGDDQVWGGPGSDTVMLGAGNDLFDDSAQTAPGKGDTVWGWTGDDIIKGGAGDDVFYGEDGNDRLEGGGGNDQLYGGAGEDWIIGGTGNDFLVGGTGSDTFVFRPGDGADRIADFEDGLDVIRLEGTGQSYSSLTITYSAGNALIDYGSGTITLEGVAAGSLGADDFVFA
ncbi:hypothetical protein GVY41_10075 [Frigidibacter albus]|uniref:Calcium-binding protein n=1 Tax=Frigidibacter albus TaxID=1465486 RepID=A0A6L8VGH2_9RHOB|nr:hypothetical protein [Frigidibacter albus]MZQ89437.1 hypothetical protein [Frigidibacter albus]NBE31343.1 hypothetical protein [Frigidibacter albus]GGH54144.1 hypothetical protein GCM10011341_20350 [Frigidibacter albus]